MKKLLLISPAADFAISAYEEIVRLPFLDKKVFMVPLDIATIAALTPDDIEVDLWDEPVHGRIDEATEFAKDYDLVGITGYSPHMRRVKEIAQVLRQRGTPLAIGGAGVSAVPERYRDDFDILFIGEAELTWPQFIADWKAGKYRSKYRQVTKPDLRTSPVPRWDSLANHIQAYATGAVQTTRGCPYDCEFCDVTYLFGHRPRSKPIDRVLEEVVALERLGMEQIFFCDDNFIGNPHYAKELLRELLSLNRSFRNPLTFSTQSTINVARDEELLELLADANFALLFIGIETPNKESLEGTGKLQNLRGNLIEDCKKIQSYGLAIQGAMIVGFDQDDTDIFDRQFEFLQEASVAFPHVNLLRAQVGTRLWSRLCKERRVLLWDSDYDYESFRRGSCRTNIIPKRMPREELFSGYLSLVERINDWRNFEARVKGFVSGVKREPNVPRKKRAIRWKFLFKFLKYLFFSMDREAQRSIFRIGRYTRRHAPFMFRRVVGIVFGQLAEVAMLRPMREELLKQIELEKSEGFKLEIDKDDICIPENSKKSYQEIFPEIHKRVYLGLTDKTRTDEALIEVFTDFVTHWGEPLDSFSDQHKAFLHELADHAIANENSATKDVPLVLIQSEEAVPDIKKNGLADEIFKAVEQELRWRRH